MYHRARVKLTDFGLAKVLNRSDREMELTSQGAGTYWYLPPECFVVGQTPPMISTAVDIWSAGVVFFQLLFGARPFGDSMSQERLVKTCTILHASEVRFPDSPRVSDHAKALIVNCLQHNAKNRPTAEFICLEDPFFEYLRR